MKTLISLVVAFAVSFFLFARSDAFQAAAFGCARRRAGRIARSQGSILVVEPCKVRQHGVRKGQGLASSITSLRLKKSTRRAFSSACLGIACSSALPLSSLAAYDLKTNTANAMKPKSVEEARYRFEQARAEVATLLADYDKISAVSGDNIRRYLGTVGTSSALYGRSLSLSLSLSLYLSIYLSLFVCVDCLLALA